MPRGSDIAKMVAMVCAALAALPTHAEKPAQVKQVFCVPGARGWSVQRFKPLIDPRAKTEFAEMSMAGPLLLEFKLRRFSEKAETTFDYKFDAGGRLNSLQGRVTVYGAWVAEANLIPEADGTVLPHRVTYRRDDQAVRQPDDSADYIGLLDRVQIYRTVQAVPCAAMLQEAEKMNATQE